MTLYFIVLVNPTLALDPTRWPVKKYWDLGSLKLWSGEPKRNKSGICPSRTIKRKVRAFQIGIVGLSSPKDGRLISKNREKIQKYKPQLGSG